MLTGSMDSTARVWDLMSGNCLHTYIKPNPISSVSVSLDGSVNMISSILGKSDVIDTYKLDKFMIKN